MNVCQTDTKSRVKPLVVSIKRHMEEFCNQLMKEFEFMSISHVSVDIVLCDSLAMEGGANATNLYIQKKLVPATVNFFKKALKVKRLTSKLATSYTTMCAGEVNIPPILRTGQGVDADIAIIVTAKYEDSSF